MNRPDSSMPYGEYMKKVKLKHCEVSYNHFQCSVCIHAYILSVYSSLVRYCIVTNGRNIKPYANIHMYAQKSMLMSSLLSLFSLTLCQLRCSALILTRHVLVMNTKLKNGEENDDTICSISGQYQVLYRRVSAIKA